MYYYATIHNTHDDNYGDFFLFFYRGSSKYHYYGIRIKPDSPLSTYLMDDGPSVTIRQPTATQK